MNKSKDETNDNKVHRNVVNVYCERSSQNENTSRSNTPPVSMQQMITGEMTVGTMNINNNNYASNSGRSSRYHTPNFDDIPSPQNNGSMNDHRSSPIFRSGDASSDRRESDVTNSAYKAMEQRLSAMEAKQVELQQQQLQQQQQQQMLSSSRKVRQVKSRVKKNNEVVFTTNKNPREPEEKDKEDDDDDDDNKEKKQRHV